MKAKILILFLTLAELLPLAARGQVNYAVSGNTASVISSPNVVGSIVITNTYEGYPVTSIAAFAFDNCPKLTNVTIPNSVTTIGGDAFFTCTSLTSITIPNSVTTIGGGAFSDCSSLTSVTIPNSVTSIGGGAFSACASLTNITVITGNPDYSATNGVLFNQNQTMLVQLPGGLGGSYTIPNNVTSIGFAAFDDCDYLTNITVIAGNSDFSSTNGVLFNQNQSILSQFPGGLGGSYTVPNSVTTIGGAAFSDNTRLTSITIPNNVTIIQGGAFDFCTSLTSVTVGSSVTTIGAYVFEYCTRLTNVTFLGNAPVLVNTNEFTNDYIAAKAVYYYHGTSGWNSTYGGLPTVELFMPPPQISSIDSIVDAPSNNFSFTVTGMSRQTIVVEASTNLVNWQPVWTNTLSGTNVLFTDPQWINYPNRFYRAQ